MKEQVTFLFVAFVSLFTIINPFSTASVFHTLSKDNTKKENRRIAKRATIIAIIILILLGSQIMGILGMLIAVPLATVIKTAVKEINFGYKNYKIINLMYFFLN